MTQDAIGSLCNRGSSQIAIPSDPRALHRRHPHPPGASQARWQFYLVLTDLDDLESQIYKPFAGCDVVNHDRDPCRASDRRHLGHHAVEDEAIVPLYYDARGDKLNVAVAVLRKCGVK